MYIRGFVGSTFDASSGTCPIHFCCLCCLAKSNPHIDQNSKGDWNVKPRQQVAAAEKLPAEINSPEWKSLHEFEQRDQEQPRQDLGQARAAQAMGELAKIEQSGDSADEHHDLHDAEGGCPAKNGGAASGGVSADDQAGQCFSDG